MGHVYAEITLKNVKDKEDAIDGHIREEEVRSLTIEAMVDTGATRLCISEEMCQKLGLRIIESKPGRLANHMIVTSKITEPVEVIWKNRFSHCCAGVIPGLKKPLLGVIPLEEMDLRVCPRTHELAAVHDDGIEYIPTIVEDW